VVGKDKQQVNKVSEGDGHGRFPSAQFEVVVGDGDGFSGAVEDSNLGTHRYHSLCGKKGLWPPDPAAQPRFGHEIVTRPCVLSMTAVSTGI
jgi:hypothetical protein